MVERMAGMEVGGRKVRLYVSFGLIMWFVGCRECSEEGGGEVGDGEAGRW